MGYIRYFAFLLLLLLFLLPNAFGSGFSFDGIGVKARGMGGAFRAIADDWSAAYYNPAGYYGIEDNYMAANLAIFHNRYWAKPDVKWGGEYETGFYNGQDIANKHEVLNVPEFGAVARLPIKGEMVLGFSAMQIFDQNQSWNLCENPQAYSPAAFDASQYAINLDVVAFQLTAAKGFMDDKLQAGIGLSLLRGDLVFNNLVFRRNPMPSPFSDRPYEKIPEWYRTDGNGWGFGYRTGFIYELNDKFNAALTYSGSASINISGKSDFKFYMGKNSLLYAGLGTERYLFARGEVAGLKSDFETTLDLPGAIGGGLAFKVNDKLTMDLDAEMTFWSSFKGFDFAFSNFAGLKDTSFHNANDSLFKTNLSVPIDWSNAAKIMLGADYKTGGNVDLRAGISFDQSPAKAATFIPQFIDLGDKLGLHFGAGIALGFWNLDFATSYTHQKDLNVTDMVIGDNDILDNIPANYRADNYQTILGISYRF